jgi:hypothetical protein
LNPSDDAGFRQTDAGSLTSILTIKKQQIANLEKENSNYSIPLGVSSITAWLTQASDGAKSGRDKTVSVTFD